MTIIEKMLQAPAENAGMDVVIVSTTSAHQEAYWQHRLEATRGQIVNEGALVLAIHEDWPGGAGNGLGTLYALHEAARRAHAQGVDLLKHLADGAAVGLYHTAGKGTRLAPLPASENNNKPAVKLPGLITVDGESRPITILESVIRQTSIYAPARRGRVSVFWGDQIFVPTADPFRKATHHADILCQLSAFPTREEWDARGLQNYGLIAVGDHGDAKQVEKISFERASDLVASGVLQVHGGIGASLGSFSMSHALTDALLAEFALEVGQRSGKMDTDPHFWMPMTLGMESYQEVMAAKGTPADESQAHHARIQRMVATLPGTLRGFGAVDVGSGSYWWDYGQLKGYHANNLRLLGDSAEAAAMRQFFAVAEPDQNGCVVQNCQIGKLEACNSLLIDVVSEAVTATDSVVFCLRAPAIRCDQAVVYQHLDDEGMTLASGTVLADSFIPPDERVCMQTQLSRHGGNDWHEVVEGNPLSYDALYRLNLPIDPLAAERYAMAKFAAWRNV